MKAQENKFIKILKFISRNILAATAIFAIVLVLVNVLAACFNLQPRLYLLKIVRGIIIVGAVVGIFQLLHRIKNKTSRIISYIGTVILLIIFSALSSFGALIFFTEIERIVVRDGVKCVAVQSEFLDVITDYYEYKNPIFCAKKKLISEFDPACSRRGCEITYKDITKHQSLHDERNSNRFFFEIMSERYTYKASHLLAENLKSVKVNLTELGKDEYDPIFSLDIDHGDCDGRYTADGSDRFNIGLILVTTQCTYLLKDYSGDSLPTREDFEKSGIIICTLENTDEVINGKHIVTKNTDAQCNCRVTDATGKTDYYAEYSWAKYNGLQYFKESYGSDNDVIELELSKTY